MKHTPQIESATSQKSSAPGITRRRLLNGAGVAALSMAGMPEAKAFDPVIIIPGIVAGLFGVWTVLRSERLSRDQHAQSVEIQLMNARIAQQQLDSQKDGIDVQLILALIAAGQKLSPSVLARYPVLQNTAFDMRGTKLTHGFTQNCDGSATNLGVQSGDVAVSRNGLGGTLNPGETTGLAGVIHQSGDPTVPIPVTEFQAVGDYKTERARELIAYKRKISPSEISLVGSRVYTRARRPTGAPDMESYAIIDLSKKKTQRAASIEFEFVT